MVFDHINRLTLMQKLDVEHPGDHIKSCAQMRGAHRRLQRSDGHGGCAGNTDVIRAHHGSAEDAAAARMAAPGTPQDLGTPGRPVSPAPRRLTTTAEDANDLERRIVNKIVDIVSPRKRGRTLRLLQVGRRLHAATSMTKDAHQAVGSSEFRSILVDLLHGPLVA